VYCNKIALAAVVQHVAATKLVTTKA
jgi:hypothetical protein